MALEAKAGDPTVIGRLKNPRRNLLNCVHVIRAGSQATANFLGGEHGWIVMWFSRGKEERCKILGLVGSVGNVACCSRKGGVGAWLCCENILV